MADRHGLSSGVSWFQVLASALAAVTAAFIASRLGIAGTIVGAALGSFVVTISTAFYGRTLDRGKTLIVQTTSGTMIQRAVKDDEVGEAIEEAGRADKSPVEQAHVVDEPPSRLHWKTIGVTTVVVLALALAAISTYELMTGHTLDGSEGTTIGDTLGGGADGAPDRAPAIVPTATDPTTPVPEPRPKPEPTVATTTPTTAPVTPTPTPTPTSPTLTPTAPTSTPTSPVE